MSTRGFSCFGAALLLSVAACSSDDELLPPIVTFAYQATTPTAPGQTVEFEVSAADPEDTSLQFMWSASTGSLGEPRTTANASSVVWRASFCGAVPSVTAVVTNLYGLSASKTFVLADVPTCPWLPTGTLFPGRTGITATLLPSGKVLVTGGITTRADVDYLSSAEVYEPTTRSWTPASSMARPRYDHTATLLPSGEVLVAGGLESSSNTGRSSSAESYDPATDSWSSVGSMAEPRSAHTATLLPSGKVLVVGGIGRSSAELYDPATRSWSSAGSLAVPRYLHTATLLPSGKVLVTGGIVVDTATASAEVYDPATGSWSSVTAMAAPRYGHNATLLPSGKLLVTGGYSTATLASAEVYDPAKDSWSSVTSMTAPRTGHAAVLLSTGKVLVAGGRNGLPVASSEVYDPATDSWSSADSMVWTRDRPLALLISPGQVLVVGGYTGRGFEYATNAELYAP